MDSLTLLHLLSFLSRSVRDKSQWRGFPLFTFPLSSSLVCRGPSKQVQTRAGFTRNTFASNTADTTFSSILSLVKKHSLVGFYWNPCYICSWLHLHAKNEFAHPQLPLSLSSPSQQLHKHFKQERVGNLLKEHKDLVFASQRKSAGTCLSRTCGFSVCMFLAVYPGSTDGVYHLASLCLRFLQQRW